MRPKKARNPVQKRSKIKKKKITHAAYELIENVGYEAMSMRLIGQKAGVSIGAIYAYFDDKKSVYLELLKIYQLKLLDYMLQTIDEAFTDETSLETSLFCIILKYRDFLLSHQKFHKANIILSLSDDWFGKNYRLQEKESAQLLGDRFLQKAGDKIQVDDLEAAILLAHKTIEEIIQYTLFFKPEVEDERVFRGMAKMISGFMAPHPSTK